MAIVNQNSQTETKDKNNSLISLKPEVRKRLQIRAYQEYDRSNQRGVFASVYFTYFFNMTDKWAQKLGLNANAAKEIDRKERHNMTLYYLTEYGNARTEKGKRNNALNFIYMFWFVGIIALICLIMGIGFLATFPATVIDNTYFPENTSALGLGIAFFVVAILLPTIWVLYQFFAKKGLFYSRAPLYNVAAGNLNNADVFGA